MYIYLYPYTLTSTHLKYPLHQHTLHPFLPIHPPYNSPTHAHITHPIYTHLHSPHTHPPLSMHTPHQGRGNDVTLTHSTFHQNTAHNIGSAVMFASLLYVQNRAESHHYLTEDWSVTCPNNQSDSSFALPNFVHTNAAMVQVWHCI